jgi:hypothetical protein
MPIPSPIEVALAGEDEFLLSFDANPAQSIDIVKTKSLTTPSSIELRAWHGMCTIGK